MITDYLCDFHSLPGVKGGKLKGPMARTISDFRSAMVSNRAISSAGDHGAVMVWQDDAGQWRACFMQYQNTVASAEFSSKAAVLPWLRTWLPKQHGIVTTETNANG